MVIFPVPVLAYLKFEWFSVSYGWLDRSQRDLYSSLRQIQCFLTFDTIKKIPGRFTDNKDDEISKQKQQVIGSDTHIIAMSMHLYGKMVSATRLKSFNLQSSKP